jgi:hypothetical protein
MALDIFSIPPMSAEPERIFSGTRRTISWDRLSLGAITVEQMECLQHWIRSGLSHGTFRTATEVEQAVEMVGEDVDIATVSNSKLAAAPASSSP